MPRFCDRRDLAEVRTAIGDKAQRPSPEVVQQVVLVEQTHVSVLGLFICHVRAIARDRSLDGTTDTVEASERDDARRSLFGLNGFRRHTPAA
jgi:hypothetical protein